MSKAHDLVLRHLMHPKPPTYYLIGMESERFGLDENGKLLRYRSHLRPLLEELASKDWKVFVEYEGQILGLSRGIDTLTLEPGAQFEISAAPRANAIELRDQFEALESEVLRSNTAKNWQWIFLGVNPFDRAEDITIIPSPRYQYMTDYFPKHARRGLDMMRLTTGIHINFDYGLEDEAIEMLRVAFFIAPIINAIYANAPFFHRRRSRAYSERALVWQEMDPIRSGFIPGIFDSNFRLKDYVNLVVHKPLMYYTEGGVAVPAEGRSLADLDERLLEANSIPALRQMFTEARLKPCCVEYRSLDQLPAEFRYSAVALITGLIYDPIVRAELNRRSLQTSATKLMQQQARAAVQALHDDDLYEAAKEFLALAERALSKRGFQEEKLLGATEELIRLRQCPAEVLIASHSKFRESSIHEGAFHRGSAGTT